jgi:hypothetical protein
VAIDNGCEMTLPSKVDFALRNAATPRAILRAAAGGGEAVFMVKDSFIWLEDIF